MLARPAAVKLVRPDALGTDGQSVRAAVARFEREAQVTATLQSPHTVELYDFGTSDDGTLYYVMELLDGVDLETIVRDDLVLSCLVKDPEESVPTAEAIAARLERIDVLEPWTSKRAEHWWEEHRPANQ